MHFVQEKGTYTYLDSARHPLYGIAHYPRIKRLLDGRFMLIFQADQLGGTIYAAFSGDLKQWSDPKPVVSAYNIRTEDGNLDRRLFMTADSVVLQNGDILLVCSYRREKQYAHNVAGNGLVMTRSCDGGITWSAPEIIYVGTNWEPHVLQLRSGEIHVYFTHTAPKIHAYGFNTSRRSSGTALIRSLDGGFTWTPDVKGAPYTAQRVAQQYVMNLEGVRHYTDQMPVAAELKDGSIALALESFAADRSYHLSIAFTHDNWQKALEMDEDGPEDRINYFCPGAGPYLVTLDSGLTALSYNDKKNFYVCAGDKTAHHFDAPVTVFGHLGKGFWGSLLALEGNRIVVCFPQVTNTRNNGIAIQIMRLEEE